MWRPGGPDRSEVTCIACGRSLSRSDAREYDKHGDRWDRRGKAFEYLCKPCHGDLTRGNRDELEDLLCEIDADDPDRGTFLRRYWQAVEERYGALEDGSRHD